ncbi:MAG TPA: hypothetical protein VIQ74_14605 [Gemmatimonadaceae bacterium]
MVSGADGAVSAVEDIELARAVDVVVAAGAARALSMPGVAARVALAAVAGGTVPAENARAPHAAAAATMTGRINVPSRQLTT